MSNRGTFITDYIYCNHCLEGAKKILIGDRKDLCSGLVKSWEEDEEYLPIIAGKISGMYGDGILDTFEYDFNRSLSQLICHPLRIAVLAEFGEKIFTIEPDNK